MIAFFFNILIILLVCIIFEIITFLKIFQIWWIIICICRRNSSKNLTVLIKTILCILCVMLILYMLFTILIMRNTHMTHYRISHCNYWRYLIIMDKLAIILFSIICKRLTYININKCNVLLPFALILFITLLLFIW
jgi:hypothetical protein